jgi:CRP-like cAMP-binding protein
MELSWQTVLTPGSLLGHLTYMLLVASMIMRSIMWMRTVALASGISGLAYSAIFLRDPVGTFWESLFIATNVIQLAILLREFRFGAFSDGEKRFLSMFGKSLDPVLARRLVRIAEWREVAAETVLVRQGSAPPELISLVEGAARVERDGRIVAVLGPGDFVGELSLKTGGAAHATVVAASLCRIAGIERSVLQRLTAKEPEIAALIDAGVSRNVSLKLAQMTGGGHVEADGSYSKRSKRARRRQQRRPSG